MGVDTKEAFREEEDRKKGEKKRKKKFDLTLGNTQGEGERNMTKLRPQINTTQTEDKPVGWGCRIHRLHLCRGVSPTHECPGYDIRQSDGKPPALKIWGMWNSPSLLLLLDPLQPRVVAFNMVLSVGQIEQTVCKQITDIKL